MTLSVIEEESSGLKEPFNDPIDVKSVFKRVELVRKRLQSGSLCPEKEEQERQRRRLEDNELLLDAAGSDECLKLEEEVRLKVSQEMEEKRKRRKIQNNKNSSSSSDPKQPPPVQELLRKADRLRQSLREELDFRLDRPNKEMKKPDMKPIIQRTPVKKKQKNVPNSPKKIKPVTKPNHQVISVQRENHVSKSTLPFPRKLLSQVYQKIQKDPAEIEESIESSSDDDVTETETSQSADETVVSQPMMATLARPNTAIIHLKHSPKPARRAITHLTANCLGGVNIFPDMSCSAVVQTKKMPVLTMVHMEEEELISKESDAQNEALENEENMVHLEEEKEEVKEEESVEIIEEAQNNSEKKQEYDTEEAQNMNSMTDDNDENRFPIIQVSTTVHNDDDNDMGVCSDLDLSSVSEIINEAKVVEEEEDFSPYSEQFEEDSSDHGRLSTIQELSERSKSEAVSRISNEMASLKLPSVQKKKAKLAVDKEADVVEADVSAPALESTLDISESAFSAATPHPAPIKEVVAPGLDSTLDISESAFSAAAPHPAPTSEPEVPPPVLDSTLDVSEGALSLSESSFNDTPRNALIFEAMNAASVDEHDAIHRRFNSGGSRIAVFESEPIETATDRAAMPHATDDDESTLASMQSMTEGEELSDGQLVAANIPVLMSEGEVNCQKKIEAQSSLEDDDKTEDGGSESLGSEGEVKMEVTKEN